MNLPSVDAGYAQPDMPEFIQRLHARTATVGVIGVGYVGLPLVMAFHRAGFSVVAIDLDSTKVSALREGRSYIKHIPSEEVAGLLDGRMTPSTDFSEAARCDALVICVPTPLTTTREPDMSFIVDTCERLVPHVRDAQLVVLESTTYPGTTIEVMAPILRRSGASPMMAFSPEREDPGNARFKTVQIPKVVGADDAVSRACAEALYRAAFEKVVPVSSTRVAELTKLFENTFRSVNIALVNELKMLCDRMGLDVWEVIEAAATKPFGFMPFYPGPGLGGHCIPIDPFYLTWKAREYQFSTRFIELAGEINVGMPRYVVQRLMEALNEDGKALRGASVLVLGAAYKKDIDDGRESPAAEVIHLLSEKGAGVIYHDPYIPTFAGRVSLPLTSGLVASQDAVVIVTDHTSVDYQMVADHARLVIDTRNALRRVVRKSARVVKA